MFLVLVKIFTQPGWLHIFLLSTTRVTSIAAGSYWIACSHVDTGQFWYTHYRSLLVDRHQNRRQAITLTNTEQDHCGHMASLGHNELWCIPRIVRIIMSIVPLRTNLWNLNKNIQSRESIWKCSLQKFGHFVQASIYAKTWVHVYLSKNIFTCEMWPLMMIISTIQYVKDLYKWQ